MPFCNRCGNSVQPTDTFCGSCGAKQTPGAAPPGGATTAGPASDPFSTLDPNTAATLCYIPFLGWIPSIFVLSAERFRTNRNVRFHAFQGLYLFVAWLIYQWVAEPILQEFISRSWIVTRAIKLGLTVAWIFLLYQTSQGQTIRLPVIGELAEKSVREQR